MLARHILKRSQPLALTSKNLRFFSTPSLLKTPSLPKTPKISIMSRFSLPKTPLPLTPSLRSFSTPTEQQAKNYEDPGCPPEAMEQLKAMVQKITQAMALGHFGEAQKMLTAYKGELEKYFTTDHPAYLSYENNQGVLWRLNGHFQDAYDLLFSVYNKYTNLLGKEHPSTVSACVNLATVLRDLEDYEQSIKYFEEARDIRKATLGEGHPDYAMVLGMSAGAYRKLGDTDTAYRNLKEAYVIMADANKGEECIPCCVILNSMGLLFKQQQKYDRALDAYERCLKTRETIQGKTHPDVLATRHNIAELYTTWGKPDEAKEMLEKNLVYMKELQEQQAKMNAEHVHDENCGHDHDHVHDENCGHDHSHDKK